MILANLSIQVDRLLQKLGDDCVVKAIVITPDDNRVIELELVQTLDGGDGTVVFQLKAKDDPLPTAKR